MNRKRKIKIALSCFLIPCLIFSFAACKKQQDTKAMEKEEEFEIKVAQNVVTTYMKALMKDDVEGAKKLYSKDLSQKTQEAPDGDLKVKGYSIEETSEIGRSGFFRIKVARMGLSKPVAVLDETSIKIKKEGNEYKIDDVKTETDKEAYIENILGIDTIRVRSKNNLKTNLLLAPGSLPQYAFSKEDKGNLVKEAVPQNKFTAMNFGYEGERIAISSYDKNSFVGIVKIDESMATQGGAGGGGGDQGGGGQGGKGGGQQGGGSMFMETPIGKEMTSLDLIRDGKIEFMTFSDGEKFIVVQYNRPDTGGRCIRVYNTDSGDLIPVSFEGTYSLGKVEVVFSSFDKDVLNYEVVQKDPNDKAAQEQAGKYQLSLKDFKIKRL